MIRLIGIFLIISFLTISCNDYQKLLNSTENEVDKYTAAEKYYDNDRKNIGRSFSQQVF